MNYKQLRTYIKEIKKGETGKGLLIENDGHIIGNQDTIQQIKEDIAHHDKFVIPDKFTVKAVFQKYGIKNANGRIYPEDILKREVEKYLTTSVANRSSIGALDHPASSELSGHDISHVITNLEWQGKTLVGEMDLHLSPGYKKYGICSTSGDLVANMLIDNILIGVSSRGLGSVEEKLGVYIVGDDFDLMCWDVVMQNSTPGAHIALTMDELQPFIEGDETHKDKPQINERIQKIKNILN